nr:MAG TPA: hypothetical protein [Crassvirales sp.]DAI06198.1 MAG TPA: hypothetical protein [Crassvirales sp.]
MKKVISFLKRRVSQAFSNITYLPSGMLPPR